jgi:hypothetical protein
VKQRLQQDVSKYSLSNLIEEEVGKTDCRDKKVENMTQKL